MVISCLHYPDLKELVQRRPYRRLRSVCVSKQFLTSTLNVESLATYNYIIKTAFSPQSQIYLLIKMEC